MRRGDSAEMALVEFVE
ncbi:MAG: hypothetical protein HYU43_08215 [Armatimonadetes bacterium]|nr:hypothetical protein [Armatimonadota bacterium]